VTLAAAAGAANIKAELLEGKKMGEMTYKVHLDGYNNLDHWTGKTEKSARNQYFYYDESDMTGLRVGDWKMSFAVKEEGLWWDQLVYPRVPYLFNLRMDPMELFDPAQGLIAAHIKSLQEWPPRQRAQSLSLQKAMEAAMQSLERAPSGMQ
jgi:arylsulfatase